MWEEGNAQRKKVGFPKAELKLLNYFKITKLQN
jgi:hypothetical protein